MSAEAIREGKAASLFSLCDMEGLGTVSAHDVRSMAQTVLHVVPEAADFVNTLPREGTLEKQDFVQTLLQYLPSMIVLTAFCNACKAEILLDCESNEVKRRRYAIWQLFEAMDLEKTGRVATDVVVLTIKNTLWYNQNVRTIVDFQGVISTYEEDGKVSLDGFFRIMSTFLIHESEVSVFEFIRDLHNALERQRKEYTVSRYLNMARSGIDLDNGQSLEQASPPPSKSSLEKTDSVLASNGSRLVLIRQELRHVFDSVNLEDVAKACDNHTHHPAYEVVSSCVCALLKVGPYATSGDDKGFEYWCALRALIRKNFNALIGQLEAFDYENQVDDATVKRIAPTLFNEWFESNRLLSVNWFISALSLWVKLIVQASCLHNLMPYPPTITEDIPHTNNVVERHPRAAVEPRSPAKFSPHVDLTALTTVQPKSPATSPKSPQYTAHKMTKSPKSTDSNKSADVFSPRNLFHKSLVDDCEMIVISPRTRKKTIPILDSVFSREKSNTLVTIPSDTTLAVAPPPNPNDFLRLDPHLVINGRRKANPLAASDDGFVKTFKDA